MTETSDFQISNDAAEVYERLFVPALVGQWAEQIAEAARIDAGDRVLDVGCGTGVLARAAADRVELAQQVTGLDRNEGMLAVARRVRPQIDWRQGDASALPFADNSFDVVVSQFALMVLLRPNRSVDRDDAGVEARWPTRYRRLGSVRARHELHHLDGDCAASLRPGSGRCPYSAVCSQRQGAVGRALQVSRHRPNSYRIARWHDDLSVYRDIRRIGGQGITNGAIVG